MALPNIEKAKDYPRGKSTEELKAIPPSAVGWRVSLTCDLLPKLEGEIAVITVYHLRGGQYYPIRATRIVIPKDGLKNKDGTDVTEIFIGGEYPFELDALDEKGQPTYRSFDKNGKPIYLYRKAEEFKVEIDAKVDFKTQVTIQSVDRKQVRALLPGVPEREFEADGSFRL